MVVTPFLQEGGLGFAARFRAAGLTVSAFSCSAGACWQCGTPPAARRSAPYDELLLRHFLAVFCEQPRWLAACIVDPRERAEARVSAKEKALDNRTSASGSSHVDLLAQAHPHPGSCGWTLAAFGLIGVLSGGCAQSVSASTVHVPSERNGQEEEASARTSSGPLASPVIGEFGAPSAAPAAAPASATASIEQAAASKAKAADDDFEFDEMPFFRVSWDDLELDASSSPAPQSASKETPPVAVHK